MGNIQFGFRRGICTLKQGPPPTPIAVASMCSICAAKDASCVCSGSSTYATEVSMNLPSQEPTASPLLRQRRRHWFGHLRMPSSLERSMTSTQTSMAGRDHEVAPKLDGLIPTARPPFCWRRLHLLCPEGLWPTPVEGVCYQTSNGPTWWARLLSQLNHISAKDDLVESAFLATSSNVAISGRL